MQKLEQDFMTRISEGEKELTSMIKAATSRMMTLEKNLEL